MKDSSDAINAVSVLMKIVKAGFISYYQKDQQAGSDANGQPAYIDNCIAFISGQVSECCFEIVSKHNHPFYSVRNEFTGFAMAALIACELIVKNAMTRAT